MEKEFVNPNLHVVLIHYPLALLVAGALIELFSFMWRRHGFRATGRWMILLGAMSAVPTAMSGIYALSDVANPDHEEAIWKDVAARNVLNSAQWEHLREHVLWTSIATGIAMVVVVTWLGCSDGWRQKLHWPLLILLLLSVGIIAKGAQHGGEAVYEHGTGVAHETGTEPTTGPAESLAAGGTSASPATTDRGFTKNVEFYLPPMQVHVILAGIAVAMALASLGLSIRKSNQIVPPTQVDHIAAALGTPEVMDESEEPQRREYSPPLVPASRFWMVSCLAAILTAAAGYWLLVIGFEMRSPMELWKAAILGNTRRMAHLLAGGAIIVVPLIMAMLTRWAPRRKWLLLPLGLLLVVAVAFQVWVGILLMFDTSAGSLRGFN